MPWSNMSEVPNNLKKLDGVTLTLAQVNHVASVADALKRSGKDDSEAWAIAISQFKKHNKVHKGFWDAEGDDKSFAIVEKQADGSYWITAVSTAAVEDREGETFTVEAMDYDIATAHKQDIYPEFRVFHSQHLGIGKVEKMTRAGIFAIDEGTSYTDPFSIEVCEKMLTRNDGKYRCSRGFTVVEASGSCPTCGTGLVVKEEHFSGFKCPKCLGYVSRYKGLRKLRYTKANTFDVTITDIPCVPMTGVGAKYINSNPMEDVMTKKELKDRLLKAGLDESVVEERLGSMSEAELKEMDGVPFAAVLKEFEGADDSQVFTLDPEVLTDFAGLVRKEFSEALSELTIEIPDSEIALKEVPGLVELKERMEALEEKIDLLLQRDEVRLKEVLDNTPRSGKLRIQRAVYKAVPTKGDPEDDTDEPDDEEAEGEMDNMKKNKKMPPWQKKKSLDAQPEGFVLGADGERVTSMTEFIMGGR